PMGVGLGAVLDAATGLQRIHSEAQASGPLATRAHGFRVPQNVMVTFTGGAKLLHPRYLQHPGAPTLDAEPLLGNAGYLSPEAIRGERLDPRSDVFSLAIVAFEFLTNTTLFRGRSPQERA